MRVFRPGYASSGPALETIVDRKQILWFRLRQMMDAGQQATLTEKECIYSSVQRMALYKFFMGLNKEPKRR
ncbi:uncharacterized protein IAS62_005525 [Cryptococcus decagattii]|uniref:Uncharacterized protein n=1 Tax=Cryptococcus decagattii TaxID=1859122 RepID=A0ABZ2B040_9TREE